MHGKDYSKIFRRVGNIALGLTAGHLAYTLVRIRMEVIRLQKERWEEAVNGYENVAHP